MTTKERIGSLILTRREELQMSYYSLAKQSEVTIKQIQDIEQGLKSYTIDSLIKVNFILKCNIQL